MGLYQNFIATDVDGEALPFNVLYDLRDSSGNKIYTPEIEPGGTVSMYLDEGTYRATAGTVDGWVAPDTITFTAGGDTVVFIYSEAQVPPTISSISWTPTGDYVTLAAGAALTGSGIEPDEDAELKLIGTNPSEILDPPLGAGEAMLQIDEEDPFTVAAGDHFRFDNKEWWAQNIICGPECDMITLADEVAQFEKIPKIGDEIQFAAAIDWHGQELFRIRWYYAKSLNRCFSDITDLDWNEFAVGENTNMPAHTFDTEGDEGITFFRVTATNMDGATGEIDTLCGPIFNLWKYKPSWWDQLLEAVRTVNAEDIAHPIVMLSENVAAIPGWTKPPFECPICNQVFDGEDSELPYAKHLMSHITAFEYGWFATRFMHWNELESQLENGSIRAQWWNLSDAERQQIATLAITNTEPNKIFTYLRTGKANCEGGEGSWLPADCGANTIVRYWKFGENTPEGYHAYWSYDKIEEHCYVPAKPYNLPCFKVVAADEDFGHEMAALQIGEDPTILDSWRIFQYNAYDIKPGNWQMPYGCHIEISKYFGDVIAEFDI